MFKLRNCQKRNFCFIQICFLNIQKREAGNWDHQLQNQMLFFCFQEQKTFLLETSELIFMFAYIREIMTGFLHKSPLHLTPAFLMFHNFRNIFQLLARTKFCNLNGLSQQFDNFPHRNTTETQQRISATCDGEKSFLESLRVCFNQITQVLQSLSHKHVYPLAQFINTWKSTFRNLPYYSKLKLTSFFKKLHFCNFRCFLLREKKSMILFPHL